MMKRFRAKKSRFLLDLEHVYSKPASKDSTESQRRLRKISEDSHTTFLQIFQKERQAHQQERMKKRELTMKQMEESKGAEDGSAEVDEGSGRCLELIEGLLKEFEGESEVESGEDAA